MEGNVKTFMAAIAVVAGLLTPLLAGQQEDPDTVYKPGNGLDAESCQ